jgi:hypothetical protein
LEGEGSFLPTEARSVFRCLYLPSFLISGSTDTFQHSGKAIYRNVVPSPYTRRTLKPVVELATTMHDIETEKAAYESDVDKLGVLFKEMIQICLW